MDDSTSDCQLNQDEVDFKFEYNEVPEPLCVVDDQFVPKVGMTFTTLEDAGKFYRDYAKAAGFSTRVRSTNRKGNESTNRKGNEIKNLLITPRIYIHTLKNVGAWIISKVVLHHSHPCCPSKAEMLKQHRELSMSIRRTIENNEEAGIRPSKTYQSFVAAAGEIEQEMSQVVWNSHSKDSFDRNWNDLLLNFGLFITRNNSLIQFVKQYDNCLGSREQAERESDAADFYTVIPCATKSSIEAQFQDVYTHQKGILCRHALSVLSFERVSQVSPRYILERWSKKVKRRHTHIKSSHNKPLLEPRSKRFDELIFRLQNICEFVSESEELTAILHLAYNNVMVEMESLKAKRKGTSSLSHEDANLESVNELQSPPRI
ncbi:hypothetical protein Ahy_A07g034848 [Arachis hypogaea]|uniref:Protein FAR1-RELATED SEQUENCE n=1 Tax=Arachis hypogaea TaxID=3818 RepID=A0A445CCW1_ARAHY|nr:hypothetical protein Ahy_A07g034848 [Arachis hypogaea]